MATYPKQRKQKSSMHPFHLQQADPGLPSHIVPVIMREHQKRLFSPEEPFCSNDWTGESDTKAYLAEDRRDCCLLSMAHTTVRSAEVTPGNLCPHWRGAVLQGGCYRVAMGRAIPLRYNTVQWFGAERCLEEGSTANWLGVKPCFWGAMPQSSRHKGFQCSATC